jgi:hypothetical protein
VFTAQLVGAGVEEYLMLAETARIARTVSAQREFQAGVEIILAGIQVKLG